MDGDCAMNSLRTTVIVITLMMNEIFSFILSLLVLIYMLQRLLKSFACAEVCACENCKKNARERLPLNVKQ